MSTNVETNQIGNKQLLFLSPDDISLPDITDVRPWSTKMGDTEEEINAIEALASTITEEGQNTPVEIRRNGEGFELVAGRRRHRAVALINAGKAKGEEPLLLVAIVSTDAKPLTDPKAFRHAMLENLHRKGLSPMDYAYDIKTIREKFGWDGSKGTKKVADFLKVSPAQITQHEKLLELPEDIQVKIHKGDLSAQDGFDLVGIAKKAGPERAAAVAEEAVQTGRAVEQAAVSTAAAAEEAGGEGGEVDEAAPVAPSTAKKKAAKKKAKAAKSKVIRQAARTVDPNKPKPRTKSEIMEFFDGLEGPVYGYANGAVHIFIQQLRKFAGGEISDRTMEKYFALMVDKADRGKPEPKKTEPVEKVAAPKAATKKGQPKKKK